MQQLLYGSADQITGRSVGGWGTLQATPDLTPETRKALLALTSVALPVTLPQFPSAWQLATRAVRFRSDPQGSLYAACRSAEAGTDHTGRPGNVVSHCALVEAVDGVRPVDWFFAEGWAAPFGPRQIAETRLPDRLTAPGGWADTARWLRADPGRIARIRWIVDVAFALLLDTRRVLLVAPSTEEAARWVSVLSWLLDSDLAGQVRIRIGEDPHTAVEQLATTPVLVTVDAPLDPASLRGLPQIDVSWQLDAEEAARTGHWLLPTGQSMAASRITGLAVDLVYADREVAQAVFTKRDEMIRRYIAAGHPLMVRDELIFLQAAWLTTPGAQELARVDPIRQLLGAVNDDVLRWDELVALAEEVGLPAPGASPAADLDVYSMPTEIVGPDTGEADPLVAALVGAAALGRAGIDVRGLLLSGQLTEQVAAQPEELRQAARDIAAVLQPHATDREDR
ncbi:hypothetical protein SAMN02745244_01242 [Tessaracoccus bendigoensis DSM 12906]|uniref:GTPase-associated protein 1 N-terminal domain-containing protein n=1 Tax=Tessaracoccus bendigoensis DSM 12906 TaxID=1123357 RepID=A0A1M6EPP1_9ACTN|nr:hypothetical protein [Tessaracoccus bendigoensis]SHI87454.1 hypothetical protein SAMN02745244_01242 [Tessaracoccus bendigoensis DSM 12906]